MSNIQKSFQYLQSVQQWIFNRKYILSLLVFGLYMSFFDQYRIPVALSIYSDVQVLEKEKLTFEKLITKLIDDKKDFENNYEKFAREKYYMSKEDEDVFVIEKQQIKKN